jgi:hypothetical protein
MSALGIAATIALALDNGTQLLAQESSRGRFRTEAAETLPPPARPETERPENENSASGPALVNPNGAAANRGRPYLGITFDPDYTDAAVARSVVPGGPADQAGIQPGDNIEAINDEPISSYRDAFAIVQTLRPGEIIDIDFSRRFSGRTQAVLGGDATQEAGAADYSDEDVDGAYPERPASFPTEELPERERPRQPRSFREDLIDERLPDPTYFREFRRSSRAQLSSAPSDPRLNYNGASTDRREPSERQINIERRRPTERRLLGRPLLRWRRD